MTDPDNHNPHIVRDYFIRREWSFTIEDDIYIRYQCFRDCAELAAAIQKRQPHKIDIGAIFTAPVRFNRASECRAFLRNLPSSAHILLFFCLFVRVSVVAAERPHNRQPRELPHRGARARV